jgi:carbon monoxide dehydrogenase subunit G
MLHIKSPEETISASPEKVYRVLTHFFEKPVEGIPGVTNWESKPEGCSFTVQDHVNCRLMLTEQVPDSRVGFRAETDAGMSANVLFDITPQGSGAALQGNLEMDVPFFLQPMIKGTVNKFMDTAMNYLKVAIERS